MKKLSDRNKVLILISYLLICSYGIDAMDIIDELKIFLGSICFILGMYVLNKS